MQNTTTQFIAGVDEVGRGPLAGAVMACAVILNPQQPIQGLMDSKKLTEKKREYLAEKIKASCLAWAIGRAEVEEIDELNILQASLLAMRRAIHALKIQPTDILVDGLYCPKIDFAVSSCKAIVGGDASEPAISASSIIAKVTRDNEMIAMDKIYPEYGFAKHKGYGTKLHLQALEKYGITPIHRKSFAPVKKYL